MKVWASDFTKALTGCLRGGTAGVLKARQPWALGSLGTGETCGERSGRHADPSGGKNQFLLEMWSLRCRRESKLDRRGWALVGEIGGVGGDGDQAISLEESTLRVKEDWMRRRVLCKSLDPGTRCGRHPWWRGDADTWVLRDAAPEVSSVHSWALAGHPGWNSPRDNPYCPRCWPTRHHEPSFLTNTGTSADSTKCKANRETATFALKWSKPINYL